MDVDIEKLANKKIESIIKYVESSVSLKEFMEKLMLIKFSIQSTNKQSISGGLTFDINNETWNTLSENVSKIGKDSDISEVKEFIRSISNDSVADKLDELREFDLSEAEITGYVKSMVFGIKYGIDERQLKDTIESIKVKIQSVNWKKMKVLSRIMDLIDKKLDIDSLMINLSTIFNGLLDSYVSEVDNDDCQVHNILKVSRRLTSMINDNFSKEELNLLGIGKLNDSSLIKIITIDI